MNLTQRLSFHTPRPIARRTASTARKPSYTEQVLRRTTFPTTASTVSLQLSREIQGHLKHHRIAYEYGSWTERERQRYLASLASIQRTMDLAPKIKIPRQPPSTRMFLIGIDVRVDDEGQVSDIGVVTYRSTIPDEVCAIQFQIEEGPNSGVVRPANHELISPPVRIRLSDAVAFLSHLLVLSDIGREKTLAIVGFGLDEVVRLMEKNGVFVPAGVLRADVKRMERFVMPQTYESLLERKDLMGICQQLGVPVGKPMHATVNRAYYSLCAALKMLEIRERPSIESTDLGIVHGAEEQDTETMEDYDPIFGIEKAVTLLEQCAEMITTKSKELEDPVTDIDAVIQELGALQRTAKNLESLIISLTTPPKANELLLDEIQHHLQTYKADFKRPMDALTQERYTMALQSLSTTLSHTETQQIAVSPLSKDWLLIGLDIGAAEQWDKGITDLGLCIYDSSHSDRTQLIQIHITGRKQSRRTMKPGSLLAAPVELSLKDAVRFVDHIIKVLAMSPGKKVALVGHNLPHDLRALRDEGVVIPPDLLRFNTCGMAGLLIGGSSPPLEPLCRTLKIKRVKPFHPAVNDAFYSVHACLSMLDKFEDPEGWIQWETDRAEKKSMQHDQLLQKEWLQQLDGLAIKRF